MRIPVAVLVAVAVAAGSSRAMAQGPAPPPLAAPTAPGAVAPNPAPGMTPPVPASAAAAEVAVGAEPAAASAQAEVVPIPTADATPPPSDHDAVVGHVGIEARRFDPGPLPLTLRAGFGCPVGATCDVTLGALAARYWQTRNFAWNAGLVFAAGGGKTGTMALDTYYGLGPIAGLTLLLGNWRHLAVSASPELAFVWFRPGAPEAGARTTMFAMRGALEAELHFGFVGVPALSVGLIAGLGFTYESAGGTRMWSLGVIGDGSIWDVLSNLYVRYYL